MSRQTKFDEGYPGDGYNFSRDDNRPNRNADDNNPRDNQHF